MIVVNEHQEVEAAESPEPESAEINHSLLGGFGTIDQGELRGKDRTAFTAENRWRIAVVSTAQDEWKITVTNAAKHFATFAPAHVKLSHELKNLANPIFSLRALGPTTLNPGESLELALHATFEDKETGERVESSGQAKLTIRYLAWEDYATQSAELKL